MSSESSSNNIIGLSKEDPWARPKALEGVLGLSRMVTIGMGPGEFEIPGDPGLPLNEPTDPGDGGKDPN